MAPWTPWIDIKIFENVDFSTCCSLNFDFFKNIGVFTLRGHKKSHFSKNCQITFRLVRSMRNDITRAAMAAREPEMVQDWVFLRPDGRG